VFGPCRHRRKSLSLSLSLSFTDASLSRYFLSCLLCLQSVLFNLCVHRRIFPPTPRRCPSNHFSLFPFIPSPSIFFYYLCLFFLFSHPSPFILCGYFVFHPNPLVWSIFCRRGSLIIRVDVHRPQSLLCYHAMLVSASTSVRFSSTL